jgi:hypothetical protein
MVRPSPSTTRSGPRSTNDTTGVFGNQALYETVSDAGFLVAGMAGGIGGGCGGGTGCVTNADCATGLQCLDGVCQ